MRVGPDAARAWFAFKSRRDGGRDGGSSNATRAYDEEERLLRQRARNVGAVVSGFGELPEGALREILRPGYLPAQTPTLRGVSKHFGTLTEGPRLGISDIGRVIAPQVEYRRWNRDAVGGEWDRCADVTEAVERLRGSGLIVNARKVRSCCIGGRRYIDAHRSSDGATIQYEFRFDYVTPLCLRGVSLDRSDTFMRLHRKFCPDAPVSIDTPSFWYNHSKLRARQLETILGQLRTAVAHLPDCARYRRGEPGQLDDERTSAVKRLVGDVRRVCDHVVTCIRFGTTFNSALTGSLVDKYASQYAKRIGMGAQRPLSEARTITAHRFLMPAEDVTDEGILAQYDDEDGGGVVAQVLSMPIVRDFVKMKVPRAPLGDFIIGKLGGGGMDEAAAKRFANAFMNHVDSLVEKMEMAEVRSCLSERDIEWAELGDPAARSMLTASIRGTEWHDLASIVNLDDDDWRDAASAAAEDRRLDELANDLRDEAGRLVPKHDFRTELRRKIQVYIDVFATALNALSPFRSDELVGPLMSDMEHVSLGNNFDFRYSFGRLFPSNALQYRDAGLQVPGGCVATALGFAIINAEFMPQLERLFEDVEVVKT